ncbi:transposase [Flavobacterium sp. 5]|uniref:transposase n=1 Tax=Flavobacterium sp. 5 TaxID=2035199 RepID=UPI0012FD328A|nr:transposase [Flavobacterium sp. 5]
MNEKFQNKYRIPSTRLKNWDYGQNGAYFITICTGNKEHFFGEIVSTNGENEIQLNEIGKLANDFWVKIPEHFPFVELGNFVVMPNHIHGILIINKTNIEKPLRPIVETLHCNVSTHDEKTSLNYANSLRLDEVETLHCNVSMHDGETSLNDGNTLRLDEVETLHCNVSMHDRETLELDGVEVLGLDGVEVLGLDDVETLQCNVSTLGNEQMAKISPKPGSISTILRSYKSVVTKHARYIHADFLWQERFHDHIIQNSESFERIQNYIENNITNWKEDKFYN